ncbi:hypothetical protein NPIL_317671 [Nephila pilipes]|uniref:Uncharacterized protein n=1 Tax=Nephila pilipes TaxID=299642 RepID=A0A8X6IWF6_NEPPI|nr:hypothetical protein NPIL_317671 [Nephila pilipes]
MEVTASSWFAIFRSLSSVSSSSFASFTCTSPFQFKSRNEKDLFPQVQICINRIHPRIGLSSGNDLSDMIFANKNTDSLRSFNLVSSSEGR